VIPRTLEGIFLVEKDMEYDVNIMDHEIFHNRAAGNPC
jgi:hypothetical protein